MMASGEHGEPEETVETALCLLLSVPHPAFPQFPIKPNAFPADWKVPQSAQRFVISDGGPAWCDVITRPCWRACERVVVASIRGSGGDAWSPSAQAEFARGLLQHPGEAAHALLDCACSII